MSIALDNFVNVSITRRNFTALDALVYNTVVYCGATAITKSGYVTSGGVQNSDGSKEKPYKLDDFKSAGDTTFYNWAKIFFANGGNYVHVVKSLSTLTLNLVDGTTSVILQYTDIKHDSATDLPMNEILIVDDAVDSSVSESFTTAVGALSSLTGQHQKICVTKVTATTEIVGKPEGYVTVYNNSTAYLAAYYTKFRITAANAVRDYAFTPVIEAPDITITDGTNNDLVTALKNHHNVISYLAGSYRALGGDDILGNDITNLFMRIVLQQTLSVSLINLLTTKIRLDTNGITSVKSVIATELKQYITNGYISTDKIWQEEDLYIDGDLIATKGLPLPGGYAIHVSPITQTDIANHQIPQIYILYGDQVGIRKIVLTGEVF